MANDIDLHLGKRLRRRRRLLGLTQQQLAGAVGVRFQQIQKYECGANRISAARLWQLSEALEVPIGYFYDGLSEKTIPELPQERHEASGEMLARRRAHDARLSVMNGKSFLHQDHGGPRGEAGYRTLEAFVAREREIIRIAGVDGPG